MSALKRNMTAARRGAGVAAQAGKARAAAATALSTSALVPSATCFVILPRKGSVMGAVAPLAGTGLPSIKWLNTFMRIILSRSRLILPYNDLPWEITDEASFYDTQRGSRFRPRNPAADSRFSGSPGGRCHQYESLVLVRNAANFARCRRR